MIIVAIVLCVSGIVVGLYYFIPLIYNEEIGEGISEELGEQFDNSNVMSNGLMDQHDFINDQNNTNYGKPSNVLLLIGGYSRRVDNFVEIMRKF